MDTDTDFRDILRNEGRFSPSDNLIDRLLENSDEISLKSGKVLIGYGQTDTNIYIVKDGIIQLLYFKGEKEVTFGFAFPGTFMCSPQSVYMNQPAVMQIESCRIASSVLRIRRDVFLSLMRESHKFSLWMFDIAMGQFYTSEKKLKYIKGDARERIIAVLKYRPEILEYVSARTLASYIGVTEAYFCRIKKEIL